jgi:UDPglucose--hexose-1-phosphate uridylyltransferase
VTDKLSNKREKEIFGKLSSIKRWNPLLGEWVIIAETTSDRPWSTHGIPGEEQILPEYDPDCYLCPGTTRANGKTNPVYTGTYVFDNDFPSLSSERLDTESNSLDGEINAYGYCRVVCFSPCHNLTLAEMDSDDFIRILNTLQGQYIDLSSQANIEYVLIFENKGSIVGVSNPHPHGQIYATDFVPRIPGKEYRMFKQHLEETGRCLLCDIIEQELSTDRRIICRNLDFIAYVPSFARYSYEVHIVSVQHIPSIDCLNNREVESLADIYRQISIRYDNLFETSLPNITVFHNAPCVKAVKPGEFHFHIEFYPPLRSADKPKYMAGFESGGGNVVNPLMPEKAAEILKNLSPIHYRKRKS